MSTATATAPSFLARIGRVWFRLRGISPVPFLLLMVVLPPEARWAPGWLALFFTVALAAEGVRVWAVGYMGGATRTRGDGVPELVHAGPLRHVRNPLYVANITLYTMMGLLLGHVTLTVALLVYSILQYTCIVAFEEERLLAIFGSQYATYRSRVPRWLASLTPRCRPSGHDFSLGRALHSEKSTFLVIAAMLAAFAVRRYFTG